MPKRILLADDSVTIQKVISITFASEDYDLTIVSDGDEAISKAREIRPDLIMADVAMPGKNGYEVCEAVKSDPALGSTPVMLLAGTFEPLNEGEAERVGSDDSIVKPFESQELIDKVGRLLERGAAAPAAAPSFEVSEEGSWGGAEEAGAGGDLDFLEEGGMFEAPEADFSLEGDEGFVDLEFGEEEKGAGAEAEAAAPVEEEAAPEAEVVTEEAPVFAEEAPVFAGEGPEEPFGEAPEESSDIIDFSMDAGGPAEEEPAEEKPADFKMEEPFELEDFTAEGFGMEAEEAGGAEVAAGAQEPPSATEAFEAAGEEPWFGSHEDMIEVPEEGAEPEAPQESFGTVELEEAAVEPPQVAEMPEAPRPMEHAAPEAPATVQAMEEAAGEVARRAAPEVAAKLGETGLPREQVEEIVSRVAKEVIEKIAWDVVPELAEELILAEINRFKSTLGRGK